MPSPDQKPSERRRALVLVVDDEQAMLEIYSEVLGRLGVDVVADSDPKVTAGRVEHGDRFDLVLLDLRMPGLDGHELLRRIRKVQTDVPVLVITGYPSSQSAEACRRLNVRQYIRKPFDPAELAQHIRGALGGRGAVVRGPADREESE